MMYTLIFRYLFSLWILVIPTLACAAETTKTDSSSGLGRMVLGLLVVLALIAGLAWAAKRVLPKQMMSNEVIKQVGGVHLGPRERVVVLEISGRWVVVGISSGQMTALADINPPFDLETEAAANKHLD